jgi:hypothetical protein
MALSRGCCCTKKIIETLAIVVAQSTDDNRVAENSPRVIDAARVALERCLACQEPEVKVKKKDEIRDVSPKDQPPPPPRDVPVMDRPRADADAIDERADKVARADEPKDGVKLTAFEKRLNQKSMAEVVKNAEMVLEQANRKHYSGLVPSGRQGLMDIAASSMGMTTMPAEMGSFPVDATNPSPTLVERVKHVMPDAFPESGRGRMAKARSTSNVVANAAPAPSGGLLDRMARAIMPYAIQDTRPVVVNDVYTKADLKTPVLATNTPYVPSWRDASALPKAPVTPTPRETMQVAPVDAASKPLAPSTPSTTSYLPKPMEQVAPARATVTQPPAPPRTAPSAPPVPASIVHTSAVPERSVTVVVRTSADRLIQYLQDETYARLRDYAIDGFKPTDVAACEKVLPALLQTARGDASGKVRAACARCLGRMGLSTPEVLGTLEAMKSDADANVRREVILALGRLQLMGKAAAATSSEPMTLPGQTP